MKTKQRIVSLLLALVIAFAMMPPAAQAAETTKAISVNQEAVSFEIAWSIPIFDGSTLVFSERPIRAQWGVGDGSYRIAFVFPIDTRVSCFDEHGQLSEIYASGELWRARSDDAFELTMSPELSGFDPLAIRICRTDFGRGLLPVMIDDVTERAMDPSAIVYAWELDPSIPVPENAEVATDRYLLPTSHIQSDDPDIVALAETITEGLTDDLARARAINRWVAKNIWYDNDSLAVIDDPDDRSFRDQNAKFVLDNKLAVCEGYSNLTVALLRAADIPADTVSGNNNDPDEIGHIWLRAYVDDHWINMDPTWDSNNNYRNGKFGQQREPSIRWFDVPDDRFNRSHIADAIELYQLILDEGLAATEFVPEPEQPLNDGMDAPEHPSHHNYFEEVSYHAVAR